MRRWLEQATSLAAADRTAEFAECLFWQARNCSVLGDLEAAYQCATDCVAISRQLGDADGLVKALTSLADINSERCQPATARALFDEALSLARELDDPRQLQLTLAIFAVFEHGEHNYQKALDLNRESLALSGHVGQPHITLLAQQNLSCSLRMLGRLEEAQAQMHAMLPAVLHRRDADGLITFAEDYAAILAETGDHQAAVRLLAAAEAMRERYSARRLTLQQTDLNEPIAKCRAALSSDEWDDAYRDGRSTTVEDVLAATAAVHR
jgi:tetratricopeptide (TPR) repeat protein